MREKGSNINSIYESKMKIMQYAHTLFHLEKGQAIHMLGILFYFSHNSQNAQNRLIRGSQERIASASKPCVCSQQTRVLP